MYSVLTAPGCGGGGCDGGSVGGGAVFVFSLLILSHLLLLTPKFSLCPWPQIQA